MKIGIVSSGNETLSLFKFLTRYDNEYLIYHDQIWFPYWEKSISLVLNRIVEAWEYLVKKWAEYIIFDPVYELALKYFDKKISFKILPLFENYLKSYAFKYSLVGKIGLLTDFWSLDCVQNLFEKEECKYVPTDAQKSIHKFSFPFHYRVKSAGSWKYNISDLWIHNPYLIRTMKNDLRYFKDANVDTIIPLHYSYFNMQRTIKAFFNFHKTRFHDFSVLEECFKTLVDDNNKWICSVSLWTNQDPKFLKREKQLMRLMQRGKNVKIAIQEL